MYGSSIPLNTAPLISDETFLGYLKTIPSKRSNKDVQTISLILRQFPFFSRLREIKGDDSLRESAQFLQINQIAKNSIVVTRGDLCLQFYIVFSGILDIFAEDPKSADLVKIGEYVTGNSIGDKVDPESLSEFLPFMKGVNYSWMQTVFNENDPVSGVYIIKQGEFVLTKSSNDSAPHMTIIGPGGIFGELDCIIKQEKRLFSAKCHSQTSEVYMISKHDNGQRCTEESTVYKKSEDISSSGTSPDNISGLKRIRQMMSTKQQICREQSIGKTKSKKFHNLNVIEDFEIPRFILNKLKDISPSLAQEALKQKTPTYQSHSGSPSSHLKSIILTPRAKLFGIETTPFETTAETKPNNSISLYSP